MPKKLKRTAEGCIPVASQYTCGQIAFLMQVAHRTAAKMIDQGVIQGYRMMSGRTPMMRERRVLHAALVDFVAKNPDYRFMLDRLEDYDPVVDFGKDYRKKWTPKPRRRRRTRIMQEVGGDALASGLVLETEEMPEPR